LRCARFEVDIDGPGSVEWLVAGWAARWGIPPDQAQDRVLLALELQKRGFHHTVTIFDGDKRIAAGSAYVHQNELVAGVLHCLPEYRDAMLGIYVIDRTFALAADLGVEAFDLGGGHDYKKKWAPEGGTRTTFTLAPTWLWRIQKSIKTLRRVSGSTSSFQVSNAVAPLD
jgi:CelD/BcsL family acetyltransferase involved in cellulose biosynthesis